MDDQAYDPAFAQAVLDGLAATPKRLSSQYFYDAAGDRLFQQIMASPEYYLTDCERASLQEHSDAMAVALSPGGPFELLELGAGDGSKIGFLLDALHGQEAEFIYRPLDISAHVLQLLAERVRPGRPWLDVQPLAVNYMDWLAQPRRPGIRRVFAFMGSNLGNFSEADAIAFLAALRGAMTAGDFLLVGLDLKKDPAIIRAAYNDSAGITAAFNLNLLERINRELAADFDIARFQHCPSYDPESGAARSFLASRCDQQVYLAALDRRFHFAAGERMQMEISQKYDAALIDRITQAAGFAVAHRYYDERRWFTNQLWVPAGG